MSSVFVFQGYGIALPSSQVGRILLSRQSSHSYNVRSLLSVAHKEIDLKRVWCFSVTVLSWLRCVVLSCYPFVVLAFTPGVRNDKSVQLP